MKTLSFPCFQFLVKTRYTPSKYFRLGDLKLQKRLYANWGALGSFSPDNIRALEQLDCKKPNKVNKWAALKAIKGSFWIWVR